MSLVDDIGYRDGSELADRYEAAVESDSEIIDTSRARLFWKDTDAEMRHMGGLLRADFDRLNQATPAYDQIILGLGRYVAFPL